MMTSNVLERKGLQLVFFTAIISGVSIFINSYGIKGIDSSVFTFSKNIIVGAIAKSMRWFDTYVIDYIVNKTVDMTRFVYNIFKAGHSGKIGTYMGQFVLGVAIIVIAILIIVKGL